MDLPLMLADISDAAPLVGMITFAVLGIMGGVGFFIWLFERWTREMP